MMPNMTGAELIKILKMDDMLLSIPVVIISAKSLDDKEISHAEYIKKPVEVDTIINKVKELCGPPEEKCKSQDLKENLLKNS